MYINYFEASNCSEIVKQQHSLSLNNPFLKKNSDFKNNKKTNNKKDKNFISLEYGNVMLKLMPVNFNHVKRNYTDEIDFNKENYQNNSKFSFKVYKPIDCFLSVEKLVQLINSHVRYSESTGLFGLIKKNLNDFCIANAISNAMEKFRNLKQDNQKYSTFICEISMNNTITYSVYVSITEGDFE